MALFDTKKPFSYDVIREGDDVIISVNLEDYPKLPSIEDEPVVMSKTCNMLIEVKDATKIVFIQKRNYEYDFVQITLLGGIAKLYNRLTRKKGIFSYTALLSDTTCSRWINTWYSDVQNIISNLLRSDPIGAYVELVRIARDERIKTEKSLDNTFIRCSNKYIENLNYIISMLEKTRLISLAKPYLAGHKVGDREIYRRFFTSIIRPDFMFTKIMATFPHDAEEIDSYTVNKDIEITIFGLTDSVQNLYHVIPPEFKLSEEKYEILDTARKIMAEHKPKKSEFVEPERMRQVFFNVGIDLIDELATERKTNMTSAEIEQLTRILVRYTVGFGLIEVLLQDEKVQDISVNNQIGDVPIFIVHQDFGDCKTNIIPTMTEAESWATKLRLVSGRPLDEANPVLDTELAITGAKARVAAVAPPLNPFGLAYSFRRHRDKPWTLPLFVNNRMISSLAAGLMSFIVDGSRTLLVAGTRSAGKTALLGSLLVELMRKYRVITIEDTLELPTDALRRLGYNIQPMKVAAALSKGSTEVPADEGIRTTLRLGDSALIVGEIRSKEALALYEAMRVGALANVVAGTIHGDSPYGVFDRVVNDLQVPRTSFKATDIVVVANPIKTPDGLHRWRRVTQITEVRKHWENDPLLENGFVDLMKYNTATDQLEPTDELINGESEILKGIAGNVKEWAGSWDAVWDNILLRTQIKEKLVEIAKKIKMPDLLEADFVVRSNDEFHKISDTIRSEVGFLDSKRIFFDWNEWLKRTLKKMKMK
ncbi:MAG: ATPase, T2SS/T4P/T4SS family [Candidatus Woesearchaeota archaeon]|jgi:type IV secretory pathway ATPase VirB11/archaellum biosynthesis ATPase|nr:ATPase, T2SS/T4P/T4SS family [Candidatus Woesearchaeota archaeon]|tara:strand:- start:3121 stop:5412 length:2292 start_codon:yes stop_codon:yes gene_type:complete